MSVKVDDYIWKPIYYANRVLHKIDQRTGTKWGRPWEVWIKITERCNARCRMCEIWKNPKRQELSTEQWRSILTDLRGWIGRRYIWFTGGEAFLRRDLLDLVRHCRSIGLKVGIISNGALIDRALADCIVGARVNQLHVSLDSMKSEVHDSLRGIPGATQKITETLQYLSGLRKKSFPGMKLVLKTIIMGPNAGEVLSLAQWAIEQGLDEIKYQPIESNLEGTRDKQWYTESPLWPTAEQLPIVVDNLARLIEMKEGGFPIYNTPEELRVMIAYFQNPEAYYEKVKRHMLVGTQRCETAVGGLEILSNGDMRNCARMLPIGNAAKGDIRGQWKKRKACWRERCEHLYVSQE